jgi:type IV fimbrial biogenesis protein FimT
MMQQERSDSLSIARGEPLIAECYNPFVCQNKPFIWNYCTATLPLICIFVPSVLYKRVIRGFTLVELMIALAIAVILAVVGTPLFTQLIAEQRVRNQVNDFVVDFTYSRTEAIKRKDPVVFCPFSLVAGVPTCGADWLGGWFAFADANRDGIYQPPDGVPPDDELLREHRGLQAIVSVVQRDAANAVVAAAPFSIDFLGMSAPSGTLSFCDRRGPGAGRRIGISASEPRVPADTYLRLGST